MRTLTVKELIAAMGGTLIAGDDTAQIQRVCTDSREVQS